MKTFDLFKTVVMRMTEGELNIGDYNFFFDKKEEVYDCFGISLKKKETQLCLIKPYKLNLDLLAASNYNNDQIIEAIFNILIEEDYALMMMIEEDVEEVLEQRNTTW